MFSHKFFMAQPYFKGVLDDYQNTHRTPFARTPAFMLLAHELLGWFLLQEALESVKLTCVTLPEFEKNPLAVRLRHHFKLETNPAAMQLVESLDSFVIESVPYEDISHGVFTLQRSDPLVQRAFALAADDMMDYENLVYALAQRLALDFSAVSVIHDLGLQKISG